MLFRVAADSVVVFHLAFLLFVGAGALFALRWPRVAWVHLPCAVWGGLVELFGWVCPLTPLERYFRRLGGQAGYAGGFIEHYLLPIIYPGNLTRGHQLVLGLLVIGLNGILYGWILRRVMKQRGGS
jgi:hypothetical protein